MSSRILENPVLTKQQRKRRRNRMLSVLVSAIVLFLVLVYVIIARSGYWLVNDEPLDHVSWVAVLDGQEAEMERTDFAAELMRTHKADSVMILGRRVFRDKYNADFYAADMMRGGDLDSSRVFVLGHNDPSSIEEARTIIPWFKARGVDTVLLITQAPATARISYIFNTLSGSKPYFKTVDIHHFSFNPATWANEREARKWWIREIAANILARYDLLFEDTLTADSSKLKIYISMRDEALQRDPELVQMAPAKLVPKVPADTVKTEAEKVEPATVPSGTAPEDSVKMQDTLSAKEVK